MTSDELHAAIMNLPAKSTTVDGLANAVERAVYKVGHRDARHAAAELVSAAASARDSEVERLREALTKCLGAWDKPTTLAEQALIFEAARRALSSQVKESGK